MSEYPNSLYGGPEAVLLRCEESGILFRSQLGFAVSLETEAVMRKPKNVVRIAPTEYDARLSTTGADQATL